MGCVDYCTQLDYCLIQQITDNTVARGRSVTWPHVPLVKFSLVLSICITELTGFGIELELLLSELELNCKNGIDPSSAPGVLVQSGLGTVGASRLHIVIPFYPNLSVSFRGDTKNLWSLLSGASAR